MESAQNEMVKYSFSKGEFPPCFPSAKSYQLWLDTPWSETAGPLGFCADCLPRYKLAMEKSGRCVHHEIKFVAKQVVGFDINEKQFVIVACSPNKYKEGSRAEYMAEYRKGIRKRNQKLQITPLDYYERERKLREEKLLLGLRR